MDGFIEEENNSFHKTRVGRCLRGESVKENSSNLDWGMGPLRKREVANLRIDLRKQSWFVIKKIVMGVEPKSIRKVVCNPYVVMTTVIRELMIYVFEK